MNEMNYIPPELEELLDGAEADWLRELEEGLENGADDAREAGFWALKEQITGDLPEISPAIPEETEKQPEPEGPENDIAFDIRFRGYDRRQVEDYIDALTEDYNRICARCEELEARNEFLQKGSDAIAAAILNVEKPVRASNIVPLNAERGFAR